MSIQKNIRVSAVIARLTDQLAAGTKTQKKTINTKIPLTEKDIKRIEKELAKLKA